jgi:hypothetical protein
MRKVRKIIKVSMNNGFVDASVAWKRCPFGRKEGLLGPTDAVGEAGDFEIGLQGHVLQWQSNEIDEKPRKKRDPLTYAFVNPFPDFQVVQEKPDAHLVFSMEPDTIQKIRRASAEFRNYEIQCQHGNPNAKKRQNPAQARKRQDPKANRMAELNKRHNPKENPMAKLNKRLLKTWSAATDNKGLSSLRSAVSRSDHFAFDRITDDLSNSRFGSEEEFYQRLREMHSFVKDDPRASEECRVLQDKVRPKRRRASPNR